MVKILLTGDWHCGDKAGLNPHPANELQSKLWEWFTEAVARFGPYDMTIFTGDMVEGQNNKNTIELFEPDTEKQAEIAAEAAATIPCPRDSMFTVYGTPFHTAGTYSYENHFTDTLGIARPETTKRIDVEGFARLNVRHTVGSSSIPYGQGTPTLKELVNELINAVKQEDTPADIIIRGHVHKSLMIRPDDRGAIIVPCLKYPGSVFGRRLQEGDYRMGFGVLELYGRGDWRYTPVLVPLNVSNKRKWEVWNGARETD